MLKYILTIITNILLLFLVDPVVVLITTAISWQQNPGRRHTKLHVGGPNPALGLRKHDLRLRTGLLTGHFSLDDISLS